MLTCKSLTEFAAIEYRRDSEFRSFVDREIKGMFEVGKLTPGVPLEEVFASSGADGLPLAKVWLTEFHSQSIQPQWLRARAASQGC